VARRGALDKTWCKPALLLEPSPTPRPREAAIRHETPQLTMEQAAQRVQSQLPGTRAVAGGVRPYLLPRSDTLGGAEQRVPVIVEVVRIARPYFIGPLTVEHNLDAATGCQFHQVEPC